MPILNKMNSDNFKEPITRVIGIDGKVNFSLSKQEIKHIRRCVGFYDRVHKRMYGKEHGGWDLCQQIYGKFNLIGKFRRRQGNDVMKKKVKDKEQKCSFEGCTEVENLTIHHIKSLASDSNTNKKENLRLLCPKHHLLLELKTILWQKGLEVDKLKQRIEDIEKKNTTDCLGYQVLNNKFINEDE